MMPLRRLDSRERSLSSKGITCQVEKEQAVVFEAICTPHFNFFRRNNISGSVETLAIANGMLRRDIQSSYMIVVV